MNTLRLRRRVVISALMLIGLAVIVFFAIARRNSVTVRTVDIGTLAEQARSGEVRHITVNGQELTATLAGGTVERAYAEQSGAIATLRNLGVPADAFGSGANQIQIDVEPTNALWSLLLSSLPILILVVLLGGVIFVAQRRAQAPDDQQAYSFGKSRARLFAGDKPTVTLEDVGGVDDAKEAVQNIITFLREPQQYEALGALIPNVLLVGAPGTGKTLLARAVAGEAGVPFFSISGSEFVEMFVGVGAARVRDLFEQARRNAPSIIFIDDIEAVARRRGADASGSHDEREQTLNQILMEMDNPRESSVESSVIVMAATNRPDLLDPALMRRGRFDRRVVLRRPDAHGRRQILQILVHGKPLAADVDLDRLAEETEGFVGADLDAVVNEAAFLAARYNRRSISMADLEQAVAVVRGVVQEPEGP